MAISSGNTITAADILGTFQACSTPTGIYGNVYAHHIGNLWLFSFVINVNGTGSGNPRYATPSGWSCGSYASDWTYCSSTDINASTSREHYTNYSGLGFNTGTAASGAWYVGNVCSCT